jgi:uncharacterized membrane protein YqaE (UPF0057 family)
MRYVLAIILPPIAVLSTGRIGQALINVILTLLGWVPGVVHAALITNDYYNDRRINRMLDSLRGARA